MPILSRPIKSESMLIYLSATQEAVSTVLVKEEEHKQRQFTISVRWWHAKNQIPAHWGTGSCFGYSSKKVTPILSQLHNPCNDLSTLKAMPTPPKNFQGTSQTDDRTQGIWDSLLAIVNNQSSSAVRFHNRDDPSTDRIPTFYPNLEAIYRWALEPKGE